MLCVPWTVGETRIYSIAHLEVEASNLEKENTGLKGKLAASQHAERRDYHSESQVASINLSMAGTCMIMPAS